MVEWGCAVGRQGCRQQCNTEMMLSHSRSVLVGLREVKHGRFHNHRTPRRCVRVGGPGIAELSSVRDVARDTFLPAYLPVVKGCLLVHGLLARLGGQHTVLKLATPGQ